MKTKKTFWDSSLLNYIFKTTISKWTIYVSSIFYFLLIILILYGLPQIDRIFKSVNPLINPLVSGLTVFGAAVIGSFLGLEIFKTPIDNGSEILILSKQISRKEISLSKIFVFFIYTLTISIISSLLSLFSLINPYQNLYLYLPMIFGLLVGTFVSSFFFGSLTILFCIFFKKIISLMIVLGILFSFMFLSSSIAIFGKHPLNNISRKYMNQVMDFSNNKNNLDIYYSKKEFDDKPDENPKLDYELASKKSKQKLNSFFNIFGQFSSLFTIAQDGPQNRYIYNISQSLNTNYNLEFIDRFNFNDTKYSSFNFVTLDLEQTNIENNYINPLNFTNNINTYYYIESTEKNYIYIKMNPWDILGVFLNPKFINKTWNINEFDNLWKIFNSQEEKNIINDLKNNLNDYKFDSELFLKYYLDYKNFNKDNKFEVLLSLIELSFSSYKFLIEKKNINIFNLFNIFDDTIPTAKIKDVFGEDINKKPIFNELKNSLNNNSIDLSPDTELLSIKNNIKPNSYLDKLNNMSKDKYKYRVLFSLLNLDFVRKLDYSNMNLFNITKDNKKFNNLLRKKEDYVILYESKDKNNNEFFIEYFTPLKIVSTKLMEDNFYYDVKFSSVYKLEILLPVWLCLTLIILSISTYLYTNKDFF